MCCLDLVEIKGALIRPLISNMEEKFIFLVSTPNPGKKKQLQKKIILFTNSRIFQNVQGEVVVRLETCVAIRPESCVAIIPITRKKFVRE